ncbi:hypothetical protein FZU01_22580 [Salmonella enterica subsp. enterica]|nr:hypothetical protein [Salmonella enterica subsp. enterica serovar Kintambo]ECV5098609.1 hypothetical protein [Salmonella enterica subsp. enterica serovar Kintambo]
MPDGSRTGYEYDTEDQLTGVVNQLNQRWLLVRDSLGRITQEQDWRGQRTGYQWDADSCLAMDIILLKLRIRIRCIYPVN